MKKNSYHISIAKPGQRQTNEDAACSTDNFIAVSDGAGGGGIYAELWSAYLLENLPAHPIRSFSELDGWIERIWETFYNNCEEKAKLAGGMVLSKFYNEGSFATLAAAWVKNDGCSWMTYGDSVVFHYNVETDELEHSFTRLADFNNPPYLINSKDELNEEGFRSGEFGIGKHSIVFCATDALSHYILMMYAITHKDKYANELSNAIKAASRNSQLIQAASYIQCDFYKDVILKLIHCKNHSNNFLRHIDALLRKKLIALDDYSYSIYIL